MSEEKAAPKSNNILSIFKMVGQILIYLVLFITVVSNLLLLYILLAPDTLPKPIHLNQLGQQSTTTEAGGEAVTSGEAATAEPSAENTSGEAVTSELKPGQGIPIDTGTKIVNLLDPGGRKFIRCNVVLELDPMNAEYEKLTGEAKTEFLTEFKTEVNNILPIVNDTIITILATKDFQSVYTSEGKEKLRNEILTALNEKLNPEHIVISVYFTEFVMQ
jgi:flagellar basal body-associated protein FliL